MSWFFGKKKYQKESPLELTKEEPILDGFVFVKKRHAPAPPLETDVAAANSSSNLYPYIPPVPVYPTDAPNDSTKDHNQGDGMHYLNGVHFQLCKPLEISMNNDLEIDKLRISEIMSFIEKLETQNYNYSFSLEESVVAEMNSNRNE
ncbi:uncharacterized protein LOC143147687 [Ptiloglossa arizonensis]|uniref:uncharacterized protein LOC143147687 n=1 Tax=Ptiloglossa arizonensis TaxID=3350558 RepID=UPI003FA13506